MQGRRAFLQAAAASAFVNLNPRAMGANEKVTLALIGGRNQGNGDALRAVKAGARFKTLMRSRSRRCSRRPARISRRLRAISPHSRTITGACSTIKRSTR